MKSSFWENLLQYLKETPQIMEIAFSRDSLQNKIQRMGGHDTRKYFYYLKKKGFIIKKKDKFKFSEKAKSWLEKKKYSKLAFNANKPDGYWRVIIFDIPEELKNKREYLRRKLESLGCFLLQRSVLVTFCACDEEVNFITDFLGVSEFVDILKVKSLGKREQEIKKVFGI